jgi:hypothetical protein
MVEMYEGVKECGDVLCQWMTIGNGSGIGGGFGLWKCARLKSAVSGVMRRRRRRRRRFRKSRFYDNNLARETTACNMW